MIIGVFSDSSQSTNIYRNEICNRIRRPLHTLTTKELLVYVEGLQAIRKNGKYQYMVDTHSLHTDIHAGSSFFFYHTYFVWEVESQIRALGGKFKCFSMPYYDFTVDADNEKNPWVLNSVFGGDGDEEDRHCIHSEFWNRENWPLVDLCGAGESAESGCCLKRSLTKDIALPTAAQLAQSIAKYSEFRMFEADVANAHQLVHWLFATPECDSCHMSTGYSPDDPLFMILHSFVAYVRAVWASCHGYQDISAADLDQHPEVYTASCRDGTKVGCDVIELDDAYVFDAMTEKAWSLANKMEITPRTLWEFTEWGVVYEVGDFPLRSEDMLQGCSNKDLFDNAWFMVLDKDYAVVQKYEEREQHVEVQEGRGQNGENQFAADTSDDAIQHWVQYSVSSNTYYAAAMSAVLLFVFALSAFVWRKRVPWGSKAAKHDDVGSTMVPSINYGSTSWNQLP